MSTAKLVRSTGFFLIALGCTGLDPGAFGARRAPSDEPDVAGFSFDAGAEPNAGGRGGSSTGAPPGSTPASGGRSTPMGSGGADDGGAATDEGGTSGEHGGSGGARPAAGGAGSSSGGRGGTSSGGRGGSVTGGRGGGAGAGGRAGNGAGSAAGGTSGSGGGPPAVHALYFSEYVEGSSSYKALEIQAREASTLSGCRLVTYFNGAASPSGIALDGALAKGGVTTLCSTALAALVGASCARATNLTFNGDDAVALECGGAILDVIGQIGVDPGDAWSSAAASTLNQTLRRRCTAAGGDRDGADAFDPALEWTAFAVDAFDGLGIAECPAD
ncbi:MAG TPA: hypothetical protein VFZ53_19345 [Polyangiaceae bacterium]